MTHEPCPSPARTGPSPARTRTLQLGRVTVIEDAIKGDNSEVTLGNLAATKGDSAKVKSFGETLAKDHAKAKMDAVKVAKQLGVTPPDSLTDGLPVPRQLPPGGEIHDAALDRRYDAPLF